jgi:hypothetical protein
LEGSRYMEDFNHRGTETQRLKKRFLLNLSLCLRVSVVIIF